MHFNVYVCGISKGPKDFCLNQIDDELNTKLQDPKFIAYVKEILSSTVVNVDIAITPSCESIYIKAPEEKQWKSFLVTLDSDTPDTILEKTTFSDDIDERVRALFLNSYKNNEKLRNQCKDLEERKFASPKEAYAFHGYREMALEEHCDIHDIWGEPLLIGQESPPFYQKIFQTIPHLFLQIFFCLLSVIRFPLWESDQN